MAGLAGLAGAAAILSRRKGGTSSVRRDWPVNVAHRGASARVPENTLDAFETALEIGAGGLELDVHMTRDGRLIVIHDGTVDRTTDGTGAIAGMTLAEIKALDAGYWFSVDGGSTHPYRGFGLRIPELVEVYKEFPDTPVNIEIKATQPGIEEAAMRHIRDAGAEGRTIVAASSHEVMVRFRLASAGQVPTAASAWEVRVFYILSGLFLEGWLYPVYTALQAPDNYRGAPVVTRRFIQAAHGRGVRVDVWTINDPSEMHCLLDLGADTIMTDRPDVLAEILEHRA